MSFVSVLLFTLFSCFSFFLSLSCLLLLQCSHSLFLIPCCLRSSLLLLHCLLVHKNYYCYDTRCSYLFRYLLLLLFQKRAMGAYFDVFSVYFHLLFLICLFCCLLLHLLQRSLSLLRSHLFCYLPLLLFHGLHLIFLTDS